MSEMRIFSLNSDRGFSERVAAHLGQDLTAHEERDFEDGEHKIRPLENVRDQDVYIVQSLYGDPQLSVNDKLVRLWFFLGSLRDAGAGRITVIAPYLAYARKDRRTKLRDPLSLRYLAQLFEAMKVDRFITLDVHDLAAFHNAFRCPTLHLSWRDTLIRHLRPQLAGQDITVASPDVGGVKRATPLREAMEKALDQPVPLALMEKHRSQGEVSGDLVAGSLEDRTVILLDDLIASGGTLARAAEAFREKGAVKVVAAATHGVFAAKSAEVLATPLIDEIIISNSLPAWRLEEGTARDKLVELDVCEQIAGVIRRLFKGDEVEESAGG